MGNCADCGADCGVEIGQDKGPPDGWQLEDGRTVCHACCVKDTANVIVLGRVIVGSRGDDSRCVVHLRNGSTKEHKPPGGISFKKVKRLRSLNGQPYADWRVRLALANEG